MEKYDFKCAYNNLVLQYELYYSELSKGNKQAANVHSDNIYRLERDIAYYKHINN